MSMQAVIVPVTPLQQNCTVFWWSETMVGAVVDPGGDLDRIRAAIAEKGVAVEKILLTHGHADHAAAAAALARELGVPIWGPHMADRFWLEKLPEQAARFQLGTAEAVTPDRWLDEGDRVTVGGLAFDVHHCPGHTPGHIVFVEMGQRAAIVGDVLFQGSIGRTDFPQGDHAALIRSIREKLFPLGDDIVCIPGHGPLTRIGDERAANPFVADHLFA
ncbi:MAG: MBL fold metallo-hydrolase [Azospirillaceae bacterium]